ncbi:unnamed protein product [Somion occarium]|uniref:SET domain-containing protein n=1 Tax=Somion occarium TaxID=3059160 RepID=A0ABP1DIR9_9APHY
MLAENDNTTNVISTNPYIVASDTRYPGASCFLYIPAESPNMVFVDSYHVVRAIAEWPVWRTPALPLPHHLSFRLEEIPGRGVGMIATRSISAGELIFRERPVYAARREVNCAADQNDNGIFYRAAIHRLSQQARRSILGLQNAFPPPFDVVPGILNTNCLEIRITEKPDPKPSESFVGCFPVISRANHDCAPVANYFFNFGTFEGELRAMNDIAGGEEITITYMDLCLPKAERQAYLSRTRYFTCGCATCSTPAAELGQSDARRAQIGRLIERLDTLDTPHLPERSSLDELERALAAAEEEGLVKEYARVLLIGSQVLTIYGDLHIAMNWAQRAKRLFIMVEGAGSYNVRRLEDAERVHSAMASAPRGLRI